MPVLRDEVERRGAVGRGGRAPADHHRAVRTRRRCARRRGGRAQAAGFDQVVTCDGGGTSTDVTVVIDGAAGADHRGHGRRLPEQDPDDRRGHGRRRRRLDRVDLARGHAEGRAAVGRRRPRPDVLRPGRRPSRRSPTRTSLLGRIPPHLLGGEVPLDVDLRRAAASQALAGKLGLSGEQARDRRPGDLGLEPGQRAAPDHRQARPRRARLHAGRRSAGRGRCWPAGWSTSSGSTACVVPLNPGNLSAYGLLTVDVTQRLRADRGHASTRALDLTAACRRRRRPDRAGRRRRSDGRGSQPSEHRFERTADLRYFGQAYEVRVAGARRAGRRSGWRRRSPRVPRRAPRPVRLRLPRRRRPGGRVGQPPGHRHRPDPQARGPRRSRRGRAPRRARTGETPVYFDDWVEADRSTTGPGSAPATWSTGRRCVEEFGSTVPLHPGFTAGSTPSATW